MQLLEKTALTPILYFLYYPCFNMIVFSDINGIVEITKLLDTIAAKGAKDVTIKKTMSQGICIFFIAMNSRTSSIITKWNQTFPL